MTGLSSILLTGLSGLRASQAGLGVASQNISNANTPGYVRAEIALTPRTNLGPSAGVEVSAIRRAADRFLETASHIAISSHAGAAARADLLSRAQASFGDPNSETTVFGALDQFWASLTELGVDPSSAIRRGDVVNALQSVFQETRYAGQAVQSLISEADQRIAESVSEAQSLIDRISSLNKEIALTKRSGAEPSAAENAQAALIDELSAIIDVRVTPQAEGGVHVRTSGGALLVGVSAARISYTPSGAPFAAHGVISLNEQLGTQANLEPFLLGGRLQGLIEARDQDLAGLAESIGNFSGALADALNQVHNENSSAPAAAKLTGRQTGLLGTDDLGFTGKAVVGVVDANGVLNQRLTIDFDAQTITGEAPAATYNFAANTIDAFTTALNSALGAATPPGAASFTGGVLTLNTPAGGLVVQQDAATPSERAGRGFSHFFGLNDVVSRPTPLFFESGVNGSDLHGLNAGGELTYQVRDSMGRFVASRTVSISGGLTGATSDWDDLISALNAPGTGLGEYGAFSLDAATGRLSFAASAQFQVKLVGDSTSRGATGVSMTSLFGMSEAATAGRSVEVDVNAAIAAQPMRLAMARPNLGAALGQHIVESGDNRGASALVAARDTTRQFAAAGSLSAQLTSLGSYAARLGGEAGRLANDAKRAADGAEAVKSAAEDRRAQVEGVNLDDELLRMTSYQNAYAAAARVIQAAKEMFDVLITLGYR